jgi:hypothetical protein
MKLLVMTLCSARLAVFFIHHANTVDVLNILAEAIVAHRIIPLYGCKGSGKSWLLGYLATDFWRQERGMKGRTPRVAYVELWEPKANGGRLSTPVARLTFTEIVLGLGQVSRRYDSEFVHNTKLWYARERKESEDKQFAALFAFVRDEVQRLGIDALLIDNAHYIDIFTIQKLMDVRRFKGHELALIFCAPIERQGQINESLARWMGTVINDLEREHKIELEPTSREEITRSVLLGLLAHHKITFSPTLSNDEIARMRMMFWNETQGDWTSIAVRERRAKDFLGPYKGQLRYITKDLWEKIMGKSLPEFPSQLAKAIA